MTLAQYVRIGFIILLSGFICIGLFCLQSLAALPLPPR